MGWWLLEDGSGEGVIWFLGGVLVGGGEGTRRIDISELCVVAREESVDYDGDDGGLSWGFKCLGGLCELKHTHRGRNSRCLTWLTRMSFERLHE